MYFNPWVSIKTANWFWKFLELKATLLISSTTMMTQGHVTQNCSSTEGNKYLIFIFIVFCELVSCYFFFSSYSVWGKGVKEASWLTPSCGEHA